MDSRRSVLKKLIAATTATTAVPGAAAAAVQSTAQAAGGAALASGPAPWWLLSPIAQGASLKFGWSVQGLSKVERGAAVLSLVHASGRTADVHLCAHSGAPRGVASTGLVDLVLMDGGSGSFRTDEKLGRVILGLAERIRRNEKDPNGDLWPLVRMMTHDQRVDAFGPETLV